MFSRSHAARADPDPAALVRTLKQQDGLGIRLCGAADPADPLLPEIDESIVKQHPVVTGTVARHAPPPMPRPPCPVRTTQELS